MPESAGACPGATKGRIDELGRALRTNRYLRDTTPMGNGRRGRRAARCTARIDGGTGRQCKNRTTDPSGRCWVPGHKSQPARPTSRPQRAPGTARKATRPRPPASPRPSGRSSPSPSSRQAVTPAGRSPGTPEWQQLDEAAALCADVMMSGWSGAVERRAAPYISTDTWNRLLKGWPARRCKALARLSRAILQG